MGRSLVVDLLPLALVMYVAGMLCALPVVGLMHLAWGVHFIDGLAIAQAPVSLLLFAVAVSRQPA